VKRWITTALAVVLLFVLCSCRSTEEEWQNKITFAIQNQCDTVIYGLHCEYSFDGKPYGGQMLSKNPEMDAPLPQGETLSLSFTAPDLSGVADLSTAQFEFYVVLEDQSEIPVGETVSLAVEYGHTYAYTLDGGEQNGFTLTQVF
jgi:hypothetical protein